MNGQPTATKGQERTTAPDETLAGWLRLHHAPGIGCKTARRLLQGFDGSVTALCAADAPSLRQHGVDEKAARALRAVTSQAMQADLDWLDQRASHHLIPLDSPHYPDALRQLDDAPLLLYVRGDPDYLLQPQLAVVGSRTPTRAGLQNAAQFARFLSQAGITICSGLADGIDGAAHRGALEGIAGTVAVVAHGLDVVYPARHRKLATEIERAGAIVSEMAIGTPPAAGLFPRRNRLISALSLGTLVVEAALKSGSLITARRALEQGREVFAIPGSIHNPLSKGCHRLIRDGAKLVETAGDILDELGPALHDAGFPPDSSAAGRPADEKTPDYQQRGLDPDHQKLLKCLEYEPASIDELVERSPFQAAEIASMLLILELEGQVVSDDGRYCRTGPHPAP